MRRLRRWRAPWGRTWPKGPRWARGRSRCPTPWTRRRRCRPRRAALAQGAPPPLEGRSRVVRSRSSRAAAHLAPPPYLAARSRSSVAFRLVGPARPPPGAATRQRHPGRYDCRRALVLWELYAWRDRMDLFEGVATGWAARPKSSGSTSSPVRPSPQRPEPPGVGIWGLVVHVVLMVPLVPTTILNVVVTISVAASVVRALGSPTHRAVVSGGAAPDLGPPARPLPGGHGARTGAACHGLVMLARTILDHRLWRAVLLWALGMLVAGVAVWALTGTGAARRRRCSASIVYVAAVALGHLLWPVRS